jgi:hypothetical protein
MTLRKVSAARYVNPLREGGSMPGLIQADDGQLYVVKLRGAGQGPLALVAELISGEIARLLGLHVPEIVLIELDSLFGRQEPDPEIRDLLRASTGQNAALEFLKEATTFDPAAGDAADAFTSSLIVWLDAFTLNVDRTARNPNLLFADHKLWLIDHGASLYFHHHWPGAEQKIRSPFSAVQDHVLLRWADRIEEASALAHQRLSRATMENIVALVPDDWFVNNEENIPAQDARARYVDILFGRLEASSMFEEEVVRARANTI